MCLNPAKGKHKIMAFGLSRKNLIMLIVVLLGAFVAILNQTVVTPAVPSIMAEMHITTSLAQWLTTGFTLVNAIMIPITAFLIDRFTVRKLSLAALSIFTVGSLLASWGPSFLVLLAGRLVQAGGAGILLPLTMTVIMRTFPLERRGGAMGLYGVVVAFGPAIGPTVAGIVIDHASWHVMFFIIAALSVVLIIFGFITLDRSGTTHSDLTLDIPSVILSSLGFGGLLYGFSTIGSSGINPLDAIIMLVGIGSLVLFFRRQLHLEKPMLQVRVLGNRNFLVATVVVMCVQAALVAGTILVPILLQTYLHHSATESGLVLLPGAIIMGILGPLAGRLFDKHGPRILCMVGVGLLTLITFAFMGITLQTSILLITVLYTVRLSSLGLANIPITTWGMNALDNSLISHGTSVINTLRQVAGSLGTAIIISVSAVATNATSASMGAARSGVFGINVAFGVSAALCLIGFILTVFFVKNRPGQAAQADPTGERRTVLESVMNRDVFTIPENATVAQAMQLFVEKNIGAAPLVNDEGKPVGFISDGDVMRFLSKRSKMVMDPVIFIVQTMQSESANIRHDLDEFMSLPAKNIGSKSIISVDIHDNLTNVCRTLGEGHLKKVPVIENGTIVGVINRSDITHHTMEMYLKQRHQEHASTFPHLIGTKTRPGTA